MKPIFWPLFLISPWKFPEKKRPLETWKLRKGLRIFICESFCDERGGVILVNCEPQLHRMMFHWNEKLLSSGRHLSSQTPPTFCWAVFINQFQNILVNLFSCVWYWMFRKEKKLKLQIGFCNHMNFCASFSHFNKFPYYYGFEQCCIRGSYAQVSVKFGSTPSIAYPLSLNYSNPCIIKTPACYMLSYPNFNGLKYFLAFNFL